MIPADLIFFDIETLPTVDPAVMADIAAGLRHPASMKKAHTIASWEANDKPGAVLEAIAKTSFDGGYGRLASVAWCVGDGEIVAGTSAGPDGYEERIERILIEGFFETLHAVRAENRLPPRMAGHFITGFDLRFLWHRAIVLGIRPPDWWPVDARSWDSSKVHDTMTMWAGGRDHIGQDRLARILGIRGKSDVDGSQVAALWEAGEYERIRVYNADDVRCCREIWCRITGVDVPLVEVEEETVEVVSIESEAANGTTSTLDIVIPDVMTPLDPAPVEVVNEMPPDPRKVLPPFLLDIARRGYSA